jgi:hypothetical protein
MILPTIALSVIPLGVDDAHRALDDQGNLSMEFVTALQAKGMNDRQILLHVLKNAAPTCLAVMGLQAGNLIGGSILIETVFACRAPLPAEQRHLPPATLPDLQGARPCARLLLHDAQPHRRRDPDHGGSAHQAGPDAMAMLSPSL